MTAVSTPIDERLDVTPNGGERPPEILGIWRLGQQLHRGRCTGVSAAQPADAAGSPRWDYAVKFAPSASSAGGRQIRQFVAAASAVVHPGLVPVLDASTTAATPYLVMPRINGVTMQRQLAAERIPLPVVLWLVRQVASAIDALHAAGWIHGDLQPANVIVGPRGHVTLIDLGCAARIHSAPVRIDRGTPQYAAPESLAGDTAALPAMDIFSLGRMLWQWLTRVEPICEFQLQPVAELVERMLAPQPGHRPAAREVSRQLLRQELETLGRHFGPGRVRRAA